MGARVCRLAVQQAGHSAGYIGRLGLHSAARTGGAGIYRMTAEALVVHAARLGGHRGKGHRWENEGRRVRGLYHRCCGAAVLRLGRCTVWCGGELCSWACGEMNRLWGLRCTTRISVQACSGGWACRTLHTWCAVDHLQTLGTYVALAAGCELSSIDGENAKFSSYCGEFSFITHNRLRLSLHSSSLVSPNLIPYWYE